MSRRDELAARFEDLAADYGERLMAYLLRRVDHADAPDVAAETLLTAWRRVRVMPVVEEQAFWWLLAIARRTAANHRRGIVRKTALADRLRALPTSASSPVDTEAQIMLRDAIATLSDDDQELVRLVYWDGLQIKAAGTVLGIGEATARKRLQRIRERLRAALESEDDQVTQTV
ncbi:MAG: RNA polymerase sigma factor [Nocardioidaceae bacterium]